MKGRGVGGVGGGVLDGSVKIFGLVRGTECSDKWTWLCLTVVL
jgi:hypothetical protein